MKILSLALVLYRTNFHTCLEIAMYFLQVIAFRIHLSAFVSSISFFLWHLQMYKGLNVFNFLISSLIASFFCTAKLLVPKSMLPFEQTVYWVLFSTNVYHCFFQIYRNLFVKSSFTRHMYMTYVGRLVKINLISLCILMLAVSSQC